MMNLDTVGCVQRTSTRIPETTGRTLKHFKQLNIEITKIGYKL